MELRRYLVKSNDTGTDEILARDWREAESICRIRKLGERVLRIIIAGTTKGASDDLGRKAD